MAPTAGAPTSAAGCPFRGVLDGEGAADLFGTSLQVGQPAAGDAVGYAFAPLSMTSMSMTSIHSSSSTPDMHGQLGGLGMPDGVAEGFFDDSFWVIGQGGVDHR